MDILPLLVLLTLQIILLTLDFSLNNVVKKERQEEGGNAIAIASNVIHIITALIIITAALYNILQTFVKDIQIEVHDKDAQIIE